MKRILLLLLFMLTVGSFLAAITLLHQEGFSMVSRITEVGEFCISEEERIPRESVCNFLVMEDSIALQYDQTGLVNFYSLEGKFQFGIQYGNQQNGYGDIAYQGGFFFIRSRGEMVYRFRETELVDVVPYSQEYWELFREKNHRLGANRYDLDEGVGIICHSAETPSQTVISLPQKNPVVKTLFIVSGLLFCIALELCKVCIPSRTGDGSLS